MNYRGERHRDAKLTAREVLWIRDAYRRGVMNQVQLARLFGVRSPTICTAISGRTWRHLQ